MRTLRLLWAENKRAWKIFPKMLLQAIVLALVVGTIAFCATKLLYKDTTTQLKVAIVVEEENQMTSLVLDYVKKTEEGVEFIECDREKAFDGLENNEFAAVIILPMQLVEGILSGNNASVLVIYNDSLSMAGGLLKELTVAGGTMLSTAQAEIYAVYELAGEYEAKSGLMDFQNAINYENLELALARGEFYQYKKVSATGNLSVKTYYIASAITAILLFFGIPMGMFLKQDKKATRMQYKRVGIGAGKQQFIRWLTVMGLYGVILFGVSMVWTIFGKTGFGENMKAAFLIWTIAGSIAAFVIGIYELAEKKSSAVFLLAFLTVILLFLSGGIVPRVFFPEVLRQNVNWLPAVFWLEGIGEAVEGNIAGQALAISVGYGIVFYAASVYLRYRKVR